MTFIFLYEILQNSPFLRYFAKFTFLDERIPDLWNMTHDMYHVPSRGWWTMSQNVRSLALTVWEGLCYEAFSLRINGGFVTTVLQSGFLRSSSLCKYFLGNWFLGPFLQTTLYSLAPIQELSREWLPVQAPIHGDPLTVTFILVRFTVYI